MGSVCDFILKHKHVFFVSTDSVTRKAAPYSPRLARKRLEMEKAHPHGEERQKTLAELAVEAGYKVSCTSIVYSDLATQCATTGSVEKFLRSN